MDTYELQKQMYTEKKWNDSESLSRKQWISFLNEYLEELIDTKHDLSDKIEGIGEFLDSLNELKHKLITPTDLQVYELSSDIALSILEFLTDQLDRHSDESDTYEYYPELTHPQFNTKIYLKKEFRDYTYPKMTQSIFNSTPPKKFHRTATQSFVRNYISNMTSYNGILLWHGVGVGKTCAGIGIVERFKHLVTPNKKILILTPSETYTGGWMDEIFNYEKQRQYSGTDNIQCTGNAYTKILEKYQHKPPEYIKKKIHREIYRNYQFYGFQKFANKVKKELEAYSSGKYYTESASIKYIQREFSNRIIVIDEVHGTRSLGTQEDDKSIIEVLEKICRYSKNTKLVLLSATPMYNNVSEISWLLNLLILNDNKAPLINEQLFNTAGTNLLDDKVGMEILRKKSTGYISYLRGEHPKSFPIKLFPSTEILDEAFHPLIYTTKNTKTLIKKDEIVDIPVSERLENIQLIQNIMSDYHYTNYKSILSREKDTFTTSSFMASNIVFPHKIGDEVEGAVGDMGFNMSIHKLPKQDKYRYNRENAIQANGMSFLHLSNLNTFSSKFYNISRCINACKGIVFIYSKFLNPGVISLALALEENGYDKFSLKGVPENLLEGSSTNRKIDYTGKYFDEYTASEQKEFRSAKYILLTGKLNKAKLNEYVKELRGEGKHNNLRGEHIKVVLGSGVVEQGLSFHRVREVHILDPWHHLNRLEQAVGRALRYKSHLKLDQSERNVTVFLHVSTPPLESDEYKQGIELNDERVYRKAYIKDKEIAKITHLLKRNAIDCQMNKEANIITAKKLKKIGVNPQVIITSQGIRIENYNIGSQDNDRICDYTECAYDCLGIAEDIDSKPVNTDTFSSYFASDLIERIKDYIVLLYKIQYAYRLEDIVKHIEENHVSREKEHIYISIHELIHSKQMVYDIHNKPGTIIYRNNLYISTLIKDTLLPFYYRKNSLGLENDKIYIADKRSISHRKVILPTKDIKKLSPDSPKVLGIYDKFKECSRYIQSQYSIDYGKQNSDHYPTLNDLIKYYKWIELEKCETEQTIQLLQDICLKIIKNSGDISCLNEDESIIYQFYYNTENIRKSSIYWEHDLDKGSSDENIPSRFRVIDKSGNQNYYSYSAESDTFVKVPILTKEKIERKLNYDLLYKTHNRRNFNSRLYGYMVYVNNNHQFYIVNKLEFKEVFNADGTIQKKSDRLGAACGTATHAKDKKHLISIINKLLDPSDKHKKYTKKPSHTKTKTKSMNRSLCEEIHMLLIHKREKEQSDINWYFRSYEFYTNDT